MSFARKQSIISCAVWLVISVFFVLVFFSSSVESFTEQGRKWSRLLIAAVILPGYLLNIVVLQWSRRARKEGDLDERDEAIARQASEATMVILAVLVFAFSIGLYEVYREAGAVPVGWLYFMAYGSMSLISLVHPAVTLALDFGGKVDG